MTPRLRGRGTAAVLAGVFGSLLLSGCAMVTVQSHSSGDYIARTRGDVLSTGAR